MIRHALMSVVVLAGALASRPPIAEAQAMTARPNPMQRDTAVRDTARRDIVKWAEADSVMRALLERRGYTATRYQGDRVVFDAKVRTLDLTGDPAAVGRGATLVIGDTILYSDVTKLVVVRGDTNILRDPSQNADDVVSRGSLTYNIATQRGSVTNISTAVESGERWFVSGVEAAFVSDTTGRTPTTFFVRQGDFTTCDDSLPHYFFRAGKIKMVSKTLLVARPAVLYIGEVPVLWLPFMFQDIRSGRRSGILTPRFGVSEIFRNSPSYRRHVDNVGYYFALSDYTDARLWLDWRSGARPTEGDPGWIKYNGEFQYRWLSRFMTGRFASSHDRQRSGNTNTALSWSHQQNFSQTRNLSFNLNYVTNTFIQRTNAFDPRQVMATISSQANYAQKLGPASLTIGGNRRQYPGREQVDQQFPNFNLTTPTLALARWLEWTPSLSVINDQNFNLDQPGTTSFRYLPGAGGLDSVRVSGDRRSTNASFNTPMKIFGFTWSNSFRASDSEDNYPVSVQVASRTDSGAKTTRVFSRTYRTDVDWETSIGLPGLLTGTWNVSPQISFTNVDPSAYMVRSQFSGGRYVRQSKRPIYGVGISPTFFGLFPGIGPIERLRHSISPRVSYSYAPRAEVSDAFLAATNRTRFDYIGGLAQNQIMLQISQNIEAKLRSEPDSATGDNKSSRTDRKIKLLSLNFSPLAYDFERARATGRSGFATERLSYDLASDLLPGFNLTADYSLFQGSLLSDTAVFKPYRESLSASFTLNQQSGIFAAFSRLFGRAVPQRTPQIERLAPGDDDALSRKAGSTPVAGVAARDRMYGMTPTQGFQANITFSSQRQRPPVGGNVIDFDPAVNCRIYQAFPIAYNQCLIEQQSNPVNATPFQPVIGAPFVRIPSRETIQSQMSFNITPTWSASWGTNYDFQARAFASHTVSLQRDLHDWRSTFAFTKAPNGNFAFSFFIALKAQPDLKFDYDKQTYRPVRQP
ncbi:MAG: putative LPS assembly protein LptD [Gemmatimonadaceae bacterium]